MVLRWNEVVVHSQRKLFFATTGVEDASAAAPMEVDTPEGATASEEKKVSFVPISSALMILVHDVC